MPEGLLIQYSVHGVSPSGDRLVLDLRVSSPSPCGDAFACTVSAEPLVPPHRIYGDNPLQAVELALQDAEGALLRLEGWRLSDERGLIGPRLLSPR